MSTFFEILGSLGMFLFGMKLMSDGLQKLSGERLRAVLRSMTKNRFMGLLSGLIVTSVIQSSSATTVMLVSFVNAGLIKLREAIGVIMGANLGTTATAWIIAIFAFKFSISSLALPLLGIGVFLTFVKKSEFKNTGEFLVGFGLLFMGLDFLKESMPDIQTDSAIFEWIQGYTNLGFLSVLIFLGFGVALTLVVQSSSVAIAITITMAAKGWFGFDLAAAIVLGENIGTTVTAIIASIPANTNARRTAAAHLTFNILGVCWMLLIYHFFIGMIEYLLPAGNTISPEFLAMSGVEDVAALSPQAMAELANRAILPDRLALFHTMFNAVNILLLIWFVPQIEKIVTWAVKSKEEDNKITVSQKLQYISNNFKEMGEIALLEGQKQVITLAKIADEMFEGFMNVFQNTDKDLSAEVKRLRALEQETDVLAMDLTSFFVQCSSHELSDQSVKLVTRNMIVVAELEDMSDACYRLITFARKRYRKQFTDMIWHTPAFVDFCSEIKSFIKFMESNLEKQTISKEDLSFAMNMRSKLDLIRKSLRKEAISQMESTGATKGAILFIEVLSQCERVTSHALNILEAI